MPTVGINSIIFTGTGLRERQFIRSHVVESGKEILREITCNHWDPTFCSDRDAELDYVESSHPSLWKVITKVFPLVISYAPRPLYAAINFCEDYT